MDILLQSIETVVYVSMCVSDPDVVDDGGSFALCSLWVSYQVIPGTENSPAEREVLIRGAGQAQTRVLGHSAGVLLFRAYYQIIQFVIIATFVGWLVR